MMMKRRQFNIIFVVGSLGIATFSNRALAAFRSLPAVAAETYDASDSIDRSCEMIIVNGWICTREDLAKFNPRELSNLSIEIIRT